MHKVESRLRSFVLVLGHPRVNGLRVVGNHQADKALVGELSESLAGQGTSHFQPFADNRRGYEFVRGNFLVQFVVGALVKQDLKKTGFKVMDRRC